MIIKYRPGLESPFKTGCSMQIGREYTPFLAKMDRNLPAKR